MTTKPGDAPGAGFHAWVSGYHLRYPQDAVSSSRVLADLDAAHAAGKRAGVVIAVHSERSGPHTRHVTRVGGKVIPDYWSDVMLREWTAIRGRVIPAIKDHPALAWIGVDFGLDDESWPTKPWSIVPRAQQWEYAVRYRAAAWTLAKLADPVPVLAQCAPMFTQGLKILYYGARGETSPRNLGLKFNGLKPREGMTPWLDKKVDPFIQWCRDNGRMVAFEPGMRPTGKYGEDMPHALDLIERAQAWGGEFINLQPEYLVALTRYLEGA